MKGAQISARLRKMLIGHSETVARMMTDASSASLARAAWLEWASSLEAVPDIEIDNVACNARTNPYMCVSDALVATLEKQAQETLTRTGLPGIVDAAQRIIREGVNEREAIAKIATWCLDAHYAPETIEAGYEQLRTMAQRKNGEDVDVVTINTLASLGRVSTKAMESLRCAPKWLVTEMLESNLGNASVIDAGETESAWISALIRNEMRTAHLTLEEGAHWEEITEVILQWPCENEAPPLATIASAASAGWKPKTNLEWAAAVRLSDERDTEYWNRKDDDHEHRPTPARETVGEIKRTINEFEKVTLAQVGQRAQQALNKIPQTTQGGIEDPEAALAWLEQRWAEHPELTHQHYIEVHDTHQGHENALSIEVDLSSIRMLLGASVQTGCDPVENIGTCSGVLIVPSAGERTEIMERVFTNWSPRRERAQRKALEGIDAELRERGWTLRCAHQTRTARKIERRIGQSKGDKQ